MKNLLHTFYVFFVFVFTVSTYGQAEIDSKLIDFLENNNTAEVVVTFKGKTAPTGLHVDLLKQLGISRGFTFKSLPIAGVIATASQINKLAGSGEVLSIYLNSELTYYNENSTALTGVDRLRSDQKLTSLNNGIPFSGKDITVLINDSGVDGTHEDLKYPDHLIQNVLGTTNLHAYDDLLPIVYLEGIPNTDNNSGHGTHCAGTVGGTGARSAGKYEGVAPGADLIGYGSGAVLLILDALGGFDYALTNQFKYKIRVISNSWGTSGTFSPDDPVNVASKLAYDRGITVCFSASNSGPGENTHNPYAVAPWVISVAAGDKFGTLADFSSRGVKDQKGDFTIDGETWTWENRPAITGPGVDVISARSTVSPLPALGDDTDLEPAHLPFYTKMSGTSMSCPHVAGIVALMLEANPSLSPGEIKNILQETATNIPNREPWEVGAGYVNAYASVQAALGNNNFGSTENMMRRFNSNAIVDINRNYFEIDFNPVAALSSTNNEYVFNVAEGTSAIEARVDVHGIVGEEGNPVNLILVAPDGKEYSSGIYLAFSLYHDRTVAVNSPVPGNWKVKLDGLRGDASNPQGAALPETVNGYVKLITALGFTGLNDIAGNPAESSIKFAVASRLADGLPGGYFKPDENLKRIDLANYLTMGNGIRQFLPVTNIKTFSDVSSKQYFFAEAVSAKGAAIRDRFHVQNGVIIPKTENKFAPNTVVKRVDLAYSLVQSLGLQDEALALNGTNITVKYNGEEIPVEDADEITEGMEGYVQLALNMNLINAYFSIEQEPFDLQPKISAVFKPNKSVTRGEFAVIITRTFHEWTAQALAKNSYDTENISAPLMFSLDQNFPNPFNPSTVIKYSLPEDQFVSLEIFNSIGQKVKTLVNEMQTAGRYNITFNADGLASGIYIYKIKAGSFEKTMKMTLLK